MHGEHSGFNWVNHIPGFEHAHPHIVMATFVAVALVVLGGLATVRIKMIKDTTIPDGSLTFRNFFELVAEKLFALCESIMGHHDAEKFFPFVATLFIFIFTSNLFGLIPGFTPPTDNINTTLAIGAFVFLFYNFQGLKENGLNYLKHFFGPVIFLAPLMVLIELVSHLARPLSLALRLRGNMMGDHAVLGVFLSLLPPWLPVPVIFYGLGLFVAFVQAYVFCLLTMVYISLSTAHDH